MKTLTMWSFDIDPQGIAWAGLDVPNRGMNSINVTVLEELSAIMDEITGGNASKGLVIYSKKTKGFIAGADIGYFSSLGSVDAVVEFLEQGQSIFQRLANLNIPTVAMIDGICLGGGFELALACDYRVASNSPSTQLGLPEILLGIIPAWGGTFRLPQRIGGFNAFSNVILTGKACSSKRMKTMGAVDVLVPSRQLKSAAVACIEKPIKPLVSWQQWFTGLPGVRELLVKLVQRKIKQRVNLTHYPAIAEALAVYGEHYSDIQTAQQAEIKAVRRLISGDTAKNLIRIYQLRERLKQLGKQHRGKVGWVHVIGAGVMGGDIAAWCALKGIRVTLQDMSEDNIAPAIKRAHKLFTKRLKRPLVITQAFDNLIPDVAGVGIAKADVIIEAITENLAIKQQVFSQVAAQARPDAILATNTSSIPLEQIAEVLPQPERLVGIHFFNPVSKMELVEVVQTDKTPTQLRDQVSAFVTQIGKLPLPVKSSPGFLVNRVLMPYLLECVTLVEEGFSSSQIDAAAKHFGMMMGPVEMADTVGLDVCLAVAENLTESFGGKVPDKLKQLVSAGDLGKKTGRGFYRYEGAKPVKEKVTTAENSTVANRLILRMVNESAACLRESVVEDADMLDAAMVFGAGFAPFRGGPMHYAQSFGDGQLNALFTKLEHDYGVRFKADQGL